jgi:hypothetical protein
MSYLYVHSDCLCIAKRRPQSEINICFENLRSCKDKFWSKHASVINLKQTNVPLIKFGKIPVVLVFVYLFVFVFYWMTYESYRNLKMKEINKNILFK